MIVSRVAFLKQDIADPKSSAMSSFLCSKQSEIRAFKRSTIYDSTQQGMEWCTVKSLLMLTSFNFYICQSATLKLLVNYSKIPQQWTAKIVDTCKIVNKTVHYCEVLLHPLWKFLITLISFFGKGIVALLRSMYYAYHL